MSRPAAWRDLSDHGATLRENLGVAFLTACQNENFLYFSVRPRGTVAAYSTFILVLCPSTGAHYASGGGGTSTSPSTLIPPNSAAECGSDTPLVSDCDSDTPSAGIVHHCTSRSSFASRIENLLRTRSMKRTMYNTNANYIHVHVCNADR